MTTITAPSGATHTEAAFQAARDDYFRAAQRLSEELIARVARTVRATYPTAATLHATGEVNEEGNKVLRADRVTGFAGEPLAGWDEEGNYYDGPYRTAANEEWDALTDEVDPDLDWLADLNGDDYFGRQEFDLGGVTP